ncbi:MAG: glycosyltransferase [Zetaproteobacteria bacterium]|nr:MAG: glycosyltransferase [Zetaproteobacteria bacterium]
MVARAHAGRCGCISPPIAAGAAKRAALKISVVIPCLNAAATIARCLEGLARQTRPPDEVIVADNGSQDDTLAILRAWRERGVLPLRIVHAPRRGAAAARNVGAAAACGDWLAFTDSDCVPEPEWLAAGGAAIARADPAALAGPAWGAWEGDAAAKLMGITSLALAGGERWLTDAGPTGTDGVPAANLWVRRDVFEALGGFDETLHPAGEDLDFCARLYAAGHRILYAPSVRVRHLHASGVRALWRKMAQYGRAHAALFARYGRPGIYLDLPGRGRWCLPVRVRVWCNFASAEKKFLALLALGLAWPPLLVSVPLYLAWIAHFLRARAHMLGHALDWGEAMWMAMLLIVKSAALSWGRMRSSERGIWTC